MYYLSVVRAALMFFCDLLMLKINAMEYSNDTLLMLASMLGIADYKIINKASELERHLLIKIVADHEKVDVDKSIICLDLASSMFEKAFDEEIAIKYSGLEEPEYANSKKMVQTLLGSYNEKLTTSILCAILNCDKRVERLADNILLKYQDSIKKELDMNLPQYVCIAVYQACRLKNETVNKIVLLEKSRLETCQWDLLDSDWTKFVDNFPNNFTYGKNKSIDEPAEVELFQNELPELESYEKWKEGIVQFGTRQLEGQQTRSRKNAKKEKGKPSQTKVAKTEQEKPGCSKEKL